MDNLQKSKIEVVSNDRILFEALEALFYKKLNDIFPKAEPGESDSLLGEKLRAYLTAKEALRRAFIEIENHKQNRNNDNNFNKAK